MATTEATEKKLLYKVLSPLKSGGTVYKVNETVLLGADEAKQLATDGVIESKPVKAKVEKTPAGEQAGTEE